MKTHANLIVELDYLADILSEGVDRVLSVLPWSYIYGLIHHLLLPARLRATACHLARYTPRSLLETIESQQVDVFVGVPSLYRTLARLPDPPVNAGLRWFVSSGAPLDHATVRLLEKRHHRIVELYGSTETGAIAVNLDKAQSPDSAGRVVPYLEIRVGPGERMVASDSGKEGTLWARGPTVSRFAYDENRLYQITESDDWYSTGDLARLTSANELRLVGRTTRIIKVDGYRVSLDEVEAALLRLPGIVDVLATAQRDPIHGEVAGVEIATDRESTWTEDSLREACRELLPAQKRPRSIRFFDSLERKPRGKSSPGGGPERAPGEPA